MKAIIVATVVFAASAVSGQTATPTATPTVTPNPTPFRMTHYGWGVPFRDWERDINDLVPRVQRHDATSNEVDAARGTTESLSDRLERSLEDNGEIKETAVQSAMSDWQPEAATIAKVDANTFTVTAPEDRTGIYLAGRPLKLKVAGAYGYTWVSSSSYMDGVTTVELPSAAIGGTLDEVRYSVLSSARAIPKFDEMKAVAATVDGLADVGTLRVRSGAHTNYFLKCVDGDTGELEYADVAEAPAGQVYSASIVPADNETTQDPSQGSGVKTPHIQPGAVTLDRLDEGLRTGTDVGFGLIPRGCMMVWDTRNGPIPVGWHECDGSTDHGLVIPDYRGRVVVGANGSFPIGTTGGSATHTHAATGLSGPSHTHTGPAHTHAVTAHSHDILNGDLTCIVTAQYGNVQSGTGAMAPWSNHTHGIYGHTENTATSTASAGTGATGASGTSAITGATASASSMPPYGTAIWIIKL